MLSSSECDGYSLDYILDLATPDEKERWETQKFDYTETKGAPALRNSIANHYQSINTDDLLVLSPGEANFCLMNVLLKKEDEVIYMAPMYQSLYQIAKSIGCKITFWHLEENQDWYYDPSRLRSLIGDKTKLIIVNFPHNPTGYLPSLDDWMEIINIVRERGLFLFSDEMCRYLIPDSDKNIIPACKIYKNVISLWGMPKSYGLAGRRIGWLATKDKNILDRIESCKDYLTICNGGSAKFLLLLL